MMHKQFLMLHTHSHLDRDVRDKAAKNILLKLIANKLNPKIITNIKFWKVTHGVPPGAQRRGARDVHHTCSKGNLFWSSISRISYSA
jgi:hypothetical protein